MAGTGSPNVFVRGFIDLIFRKDGTYYVADWKSNLLETGYDQASLEKSMADADYHLQYKLYSIAALRWLRQSPGQAVRFGEALGGRILLLSAGHGPGQGRRHLLCPARDAGAA